jgi:Delta24-sterol reductase
VKVDVAAEKKALRESWLAWLLALFWSICPLTGIYGVLHAVIGGEYLLPRHYPWKIKPKVE